MKEKEDEEEDEEEEEKQTVIGLPRNVPRMLIYI
jgi:hypothetical protein